MAFLGRPVLDHQPVAAFLLLRLDQYPFALQTRAVEFDFVFIWAVLQELVRSGVPDGHGARAVPVGDDAMEREVLKRVILGMDREPPLAGLERRTLRHGPRCEDATHLEAHVPMQPRRVMAMDDVSARRGALGLLALRLRRPFEVAFALILGEAHAVTPPIVTEAGARPRSPTLGGACAVVV